MTECAICNGKDAREILLIDKPDRFEQSVGIEPDGYARAWIECKQCGAATNAMQDNNASRIEALRSAYYEVDFLNSDIGEKYRYVMSLPESKSDNAGRVRRVVEVASKWLGESTPPRVMDIGAGTGVFLSRLVDQTSGAWPAVGVEPDPRAASHLKKLAKFEVVEALFCGQSELKDFNLITLNKVLEHIERPLPFLETVAESLDAGNGLLYIEVPDKLTALLRPPEDNILGALHCHLYDPKSLGYLIGLAGLELLQVNRVLDPSGKLTVYAFAAPFQSVEAKGFLSE